MANHSGYVFVAPDGRWLQRRVVASHGPTDTIVWSLTTHLDAAHLFPFPKIGPLKGTRGFDEIARTYDVSSAELEELLYPVPATSVQRIELGKTTNHK